MEDVGPVAKPSPTRPVWHVNSYGIAEKRPPAREPLLIMTLVGCVLGPLIIFIIEQILQTMQLRHEYNVQRDPSTIPVVSALSLSNPTKVVSLIILVIILVGACQPACDISSVRSRLWQFLLLSGLLAWVLGMGFGEYNWMEHYDPYWTINDLATYPDVNPMSDLRDGPWTEWEMGYHDNRGQQFMDAGQIEFLPGSIVNTSLSYGFKNKDIYCVAPIVYPNGNQANLTHFKGYNDGNRRGLGMQNFNFWAIGLNCCSGHGPDYHCGEYANPAVHKGLRLMKPKDRNYFRLAVKEAEAAFNIQADFPVFLYYMTSPSEEIKSYKDDGDKMILMSALGFGVFQVFITWLAVSFYI